MPARRLKDLLNAPLATAYSRVIVFMSPVVLTVAGYAGYHWVNNKIAESPAMVSVTNESAETKRRVTSLEVQHELDLQREAADRKILIEVKDDVKTVVATVNRMAGAMGVRDAPRVTDVSGASTVASTP